MYDVYVYINIKKERAAERVAFFTFVLVFKYTHEATNRVHLDLPICHSYLSGRAPRAL